VTGRVRRRILGLTEGILVRRDPPKEKQARWTKATTSHGFVRAKSGADFIDVGAVGANALV